MNVMVSLVSIAYFLWLIYVLKYGVMESKNRRKMTKKEKNIRQVKTIVFTILMYAVLIKVSAKYFRIGAGILLFQISAVTAERIIILWKKKISKRKLSSF
jgi:small neutral amino acid transporter SnatA (MarC family)